MKKILKFAIPLLLVVAVGVGAAFALKNYEPYNLRSIQTDPGAQLLRSLDRTKSALISGLAFTIPDAVTEASDTGSIGLNMVTPDGVKLTNTIYLRNDQFAITGNIGAEGKTEAFGFWVSDKEVVAQMPASLSGNAYGVNLTTLNQELEGAALLEMLGISAEEARELLDAITAMSPDDTRNNHDWKNLLETKQKLEDLFNTCAVSVNKQTVIIGAEQIEGFHIVYTVTPAQLCEALDIVTQWIFSTDGYKEAMAETPGTQQEGATALEEAKKQIFAYNATTMFEVYLHPDTQVIMQANLRIDWLEETQAAYISATMTLGADPVQSALYDLALMTKLPNDTKKEYHLEYHRSHAHNLPSRKLVLATLTDEFILFDIQINSLTGAFDLELFDRAYKLAGKAVSSESETQLIFTETTMGELSIVFKQQAEVPTPPKYINLLTANKTELESLAELVESLMPEPDYPFDEKEADISISDNNWNFYYTYVIHDYDTLGELLTEEGIAITENGQIAHIACDEDFTGAYWEVYVDGERIDGNLFEYALGNIVSISIVEMEDENA